MKKLVGQSQFKKGIMLPFQVYQEGDGIDQRRHLHIVTIKPFKYSKSEYENIFRSTAQKFEWIYNEIDIQFIEFQEEIKWVFDYSLKSGYDAFIPEASYVPHIS
jgi:hypothetical protein